MRDSILLRDLFTCQMCGALLKAGKGSPRAAVVDHVKPTELEPDLALDPDNLRAVCKACHDGPCQSIEARHQGDAEAIRRAKLAYRPVGLDGYPLSVG